MMILEINMGQIIYIGLYRTGLKKALSAANLKKVAEKQKNIAILVNFVENLWKMKIVEY